MFGTEPMARMTCDASTCRPSSQATYTPSSVRGDARGACALEEVHAPAEELVLEHGRHLGVLQRQHLLARDDERHLAAERAEHVRELDAGHARADHAQVTRDLRRRIRLAGGEHALAVERRPVGDPRPGAGGDHEDVARDLGAAAGLALDRDRVRVDEAGGAADELHALRLEQIRGPSVRSCSSIACTRWRSAVTSSAPFAARPIVAARSSPTSSPPVAIMAFEGMQSHRWAAPPMTSRSTRVTSAPSVAATVAAVLPPGPPPMITSRRVTRAKLTPPRHGLPVRSAERRCGPCPSTDTTRSTTAGSIIAAERAARPYTTAPSTAARTRTRAMPVLSRTRGPDPAGDLSDR